MYLSSLEYLAALLYCHLGLVPAGRCGPSFDVQLLLLIAAERLFIFIVVSSPQILTAVSTTQNQIKQ